jgi:hypothetical protein
MSMATLAEPETPRGALLFVLVAVGAAGLAAGIVLWAKLGTAVFFDMIAAGIAYCL